MMENEKNEGFRIMFPERLDTGSAPLFEKQLKEQVEGLASDTNIIMDLDNLTYISSTGLRIILRLKKSFPRCEMVNVGPEPRKILEMTGFTDFMIVHLKPMVIPPVEGEIIARGSNGEIYSIGEDIIVKMFTEKTTLAEIEEEWNKAKTAFTLGIPCVICYSVVNDGKRNGIMFEKLNTKTLDKLIYKDYENFDRYADMFADLFYSIHTTSDRNRKLMSVKENQISLVESADYLTDKEKTELYSFLKSIPETDTIIHGDFHPRNLGMVDGELIAIDMAEIGYGHPVFDFVSTYYDLVFSGRTFPEVTPFFFGLEIPDLKRLWDRMLQQYFGGLSEEDANWINEMLDELVGLRTIMLPILHPNKPKEKHEEWIRIGRERLDGKLVELSEKVRRFDHDFLHR